MKKITMKPRFKHLETGYHKAAKEILAGWINGIQEYKLMYKGSIVIVPDVVRIENGVIIAAYEVTHKNKLNGKKLGMYEYWCYMNNYTLSVYEISVDFILSQTSKPLHISADCYLIDPLNIENWLF